MRATSGPRSTARLARYDPGNRHAVNYMWYTTGVAYNVAKIKKRLGKPITSWDQVLKPEALKKLADCGVYVLDSPGGHVRDRAQLPEARSEFEKSRRISSAPPTILANLRRYIKKFHSSEYINALANGDICLAIGWSGDSLQARNRAREAGADVDIAYVIPNEGTLMSIDNLAIPKDAPHLDGSLSLHRLSASPDIAARNSVATNFANGVAPSRPLIDKAVANDPSVYPNDATMRRLFTVTAPDQAVQKMITRMWTTVKTGR